jgi:transposase
MRLPWEGGLAGLRWQVRGGNRARLTPNQRAEVSQRLHETRPDHWLGAHERSTALPFWTIEDVIVLIERWYGVSWQSRTSYWTLLHACGLSVQRVNSHYHARPAAEVIAQTQAQVEKK